MIKAHLNNKRHLMQRTSRIYLTRTNAAKVEALDLSTAHLNRLCWAGWQVGNSIPLGMDKRGVWIELILEKARPPLREEGRIIGIDRGFRKAFVTSDRQEIGAEIKDLIKQKGKRSKTSYHHIKAEVFRALKQIKLEGVKAIVLEDCAM
jgi:putative transposase